MIQKKVSIMADGLILQTGKEKTGPILITLPFFIY
jgi:hypothetical protein